VSRVQAMMVRVYLSEADHEMKALLNCLHDELKVRGVTVMRGIAGYGSSGVVHKSSLVDLSLDLPLVLEFFDLPEKAQRAIARVADFVEPGHVVSWPVTVEGGTSHSTASR
jgi:PII-like signaling protein